jgi:hypothetical protein
MSARRPTSAELDRALSAQLVVAWAGERAEDPPRLNWWNTNLISEFGGEDLFRELMPTTWAWATMQAAREAARRHDARARAADHDPDQLRSLFHLGTAIDERLDERLAEHKAKGRPPEEALPLYGAAVRGGFDRERFAAWLADRPAVAHQPSPTGHALVNAPATTLSALIDALLVGLLPLDKAYPLPHTREAA